MPNATGRGRRAPSASPASPRRRWSWVATIACSTACASGPPSTSPPSAAAATSSDPLSSAPVAAGVQLAALQREAAALDGLLTSELATQFVGAVPDLPAIAPREVYVSADRTRAYNRAAFAALPPSEQTGLERRVLDEAYYYTGRYGTPLSYARAFEVLASHDSRGWRGKKVLDFGYGYIGHLRLLASLGAAATGLEVDPLPAALYSEPGDVGAITSRTGPAGTLRLLTGRFPADAAVTQALGTGYDLFVAKNVLKQGFVHPSQPVPLERTLQLGVDDATFVRAVWDLLAPGGIVLLYNLYPAQNPPGQPFIPWAEGRTPFAREVWEAAGFDVQAFDRDDTTAIRELAGRLGWDLGEDALDLQALFAVYLVAVKR